MSIGQTLLSIVISVRVRFWVEEHDKNVYMYIRGRMVVIVTARSIDTVYIY